MRKPLQRRWCFRCSRCRWSPHAPSCACRHGCEAITSVAVASSQICLSHLYTADIVDACRDGDKQRVLPCQHRFHMECIDQWLSARRPLCPICKCANHLGRAARTYPHVLAPCGHVLSCYDCVCLAMSLAACCQSALPHALPAGCCHANTRLLYPWLSSFTEACAMQVGCWTGVPELS
jgi:RING-H2 zinc finger domain